MPGATSISGPAPARKPNPSARKADSQMATTAATMNPVRGSTRAMAVPKSCQPLARSSVMACHVPRVGSPKALESR